MRPASLCILVTLAFGASPARATTLPTEIIARLSAGQLPEAADMAVAILAHEPTNAPAHALLAFTRYASLGQHLAADFRKQSRFDDPKYLKEVLALVDAQLTLVDTDLAAATSSDFALEVCPACWRVDWFGDGDYSPRDQQLLEVKKDVAGKKIPDKDPRRRPTFRLDEGDVWLARGLVSLQHALWKIVLGYDMVDLRQKVKHFSFSPIVVVLRDAKSLAAAQTLFLAGLEQLERARVAYLAETDDDRELVPNPRQKNHPFPAHPDALAYAVWAGIDGALTKLVRGEEGVSLADWTHALAPKSKEVATGFLDVSRLFTAPHDLTFSPGELKRHPPAGFAHLFGDSIVPAMTPSPIVTLLLQLEAQQKRDKKKRQ